MTNPNDPNQPQKPTIDLDSETGNEVSRPESDVVDVDASTDAEMDDSADFDPSMFDPAMFGQVQEMMDKLQKTDELERENTELKNRLGRLAADFESFRRRTADDATEAKNKGTADAAEALMPVFDDISRALEMGSGDPAKLLPGFVNVQNKVLSVFEKLGLSATGQEGEHFDPQWHEALQVVPGEQDDVVVQVFQRGFRMGDRLVRPARVVVSKKA
ncbi:nucleotide exchange factor GrpE [Deinococcus sp. KNUC1210]|uniref:nucleotide exchange factor GrpE n=1 Tax=Deinococcus sp. KNUC1210 TaxID=2917691 RepID=UPI001EF01E2A|nr:nucleotide exchange factor GrpE [Deinococcus sp. KNUC1210]ULH16092.1 nucleotide exchange factor GrpE [Deinococcus sp. KNUC1210]